MPPDGEAGHRCLAPVAEHDRVPDADTRRGRLSDPPAASLATCAVSVMSIRNDTSTLNLSKLQAYI